MSIFRKKILLFVPKFLGYDEIIKKELISRGAFVRSYDERPSSNSIIKFLIRINPSLVEPLSRRYFLNIFKKEENSDFDFIFIIKGEAISSNVIKLMRNFFENSKLIYYTWDSLRNVKFSNQKIEMFDRVFSFDRDDSKKDKRINYLPLFFSPIFNISNFQEPNKTVNDIVFIASLHSDRYEVFQKILLAMSKIKPKFNSYYFLFYSSKLFFFIRKIFDKQFSKILYKDVSWKPLSHESVVQNILKANIIVDINHPNQTGLTMRTIESLSLKKKLITTNQNIKYEPFYNKTNILIVDRKRPVIPLEFISSSYKSIDEVIIKKYSVTNWISNIFNETI